MGTEKRPISIYFALTTSGPNGAIGYAGIDPTEQIDSFEIVNNVRSIILFSTKTKAEEHLRFKPDKLANITPIPANDCRQVLLQLKKEGLYTEVALDPGTVILKSQPIDKFIAAMPYRTHSDD